MEIPWVILLIFMIAFIISSIVYKWMESHPEVDE